MCIQKHTVLVWRVVFVHKDNLSKLADIINYIHV